MNQDLLSEEIVTYVELGPDNDNCDSPSHLNGSAGPTTIGGVEMTTNPLVEKSQLRSESNSTSVP